MKPINLRRVRDHVACLAGYDMPGTSEMLSDMATEIEALRAALRCELDEGDLEACGPRDDLRALLPAKETA